MGKKLLKTHKVDFHEDVMQMQWYVFLANFNWERKAAENVEKRFESLGCADKFGEIIVPIVDIETVSPKGRKATKPENLYGAGYVFIKMIMDNTTWNIVRQTTGVAGWLTRDGRPHPMNEDEVMGIRQRLGLNQEEVTIVKDYEFNYDQVVTINSGVMKGYQGKITEINNDKQMLSVTLTLNGYDLKVGFDQVEVN